MNQTRGKGNDSMKNPWSELPPPVASYVQKKLETVDWETALQQLRSVCADCPARQLDDEEICLACPFEGLACMAATVSLKAKIAKTQAKSQKRKKVKSSLLQIAEKVEENK